MSVFKKLLILKEKIERVQKLNEDLIETYLAKNNKIQSLEKKNKILKSGIKESANEIEKYLEDIDANN